nr:hypothetical protein [Tanacetum cinerariifolium]
MEDKHLSTILETESDEIKKSSVENFVSIPREYKVTFDNESKCVVPVFEDSSFNTLNDHSEILSDSNNDDTSSDDNAFEDIEFVEASLSDSELVSLEEVNNGDHEENEIDLEDILQIQDIEPDKGRLTSVVMDNIFDYSTNDPFLEAVDLFFASDNSTPPGIFENINYDSEGDIHFLKELLSNDPLPLLENESFNFDHHDDPSFPRPLSEPPDVEVFFDFEPNSGELISAVKNNIDELNEDECFDPMRGTDTLSLVNHNAYMVSSSAPQIAYALMDQQSSEYSPPEAGLVVPVFQKGDDPIDAINHMMSFLTSVVASRYPATNNQLRTYSNPCQQATINNGRVTIQPIQGR